MNYRRSERTLSLGGGRVVLGRRVVRVHVLVVHVLGRVVVLPVLLAVPAVLVAPPNTGPESVVLALLVAGDVVVRVASVPAELVLFVRGDIHVLEVSVGLLPVAGGAIALLCKLVAAGRGRPHSAPRRP